MEIKDRTIQTNKNERDGDCIIVDEYGIENGEVYHRHIAISWDIYKAFEKNPDSDIRLDDFLKRHHIDSEWSRYVPTGENGDEGHRQKYKAISDKETLINDPLMMNVFNEAIRGDSEWASWESVFPFFR